MPDSLPSTIRSSSRSRKRTWKVSDNDEQEVIPSYTFLNSLLRISETTSQFSSVVGTTSEIMVQNVSYDDACRSPRDRRNMVFLARQPLQLDANGVAVSIRHYLGACDIVCGKCQALHWLQEAVARRVQSQPNYEFSSCCQTGRVVLPPLNPPLPLLRQLFQDGTVGTLQLHSSTADFVN